MNTKEKKTDEFYHFDGIGCKSCEKFITDKVLKLDSQAEIIFDENHKCLVKIISDIVDLDQLKTTFKDTKYKVSLKDCCTKKDTKEKNSCC